MKNLVILVYSGDSGDFGESCESGHSCETSDSDDSGDSGESGDSSESCYFGESGDLINPVQGRGGHNFLSSYHNFL